MLAATRASAVGGVRRQADRATSSRDVIRGAAPSNWDAGNPVQVMIDFLGAHGRLRRTGEREPDGGAWVLADAEGDER